MTDDEKARIERTCLESGARRASFIDPATIAIGEWVRHKCQYGCPDYGARSCCPPHTPTPETTRRIVAEYGLAVLLHFVGDVRDPRIVVDIENAIFLLGHPKAIGFAAGPCRICPACSIPICAHPERMRPSMEACGIDVFATARANGFPIEVLTTREDEENCYGLVLID